MSDPHPDPDPSLVSLAPWILRHHHLAGIALGSNSGILGSFPPSPSQAQPGNLISLGQSLQLPVLLLPPAGIPGADGFMTVFLGCNNPQNYIGSFPWFSLFFSPTSFCSCSNRKTKQSWEGSPSGRVVGRAMILRSFPGVFQDVGMTLWI